LGHRFAVPRDHDFFAAFDRTNDFRKAVLRLRDADVHDSIIAISDGHFNDTLRDGKNCKRAAGA
jgi:hypothetical protein